MSLFLGSYHLLFTTTARTLTYGQLFLYPVKSLLPVEVTATELTNEGLRFDRQFVLVKPLKDPLTLLAEHLTIKTTFELCLFQPSIDESWSKLTITHTLANPTSSLTIALTPSPISLMDSKTYHVSVFGTTAVGVDMGIEAASFFSTHLNQPVRLLYIAGSGRREIPGAAYVKGQMNALALKLHQSSSQPQRIRFADAAPLLVTSTASEADARLRLPHGNQHEDVILRFRPNVHVEVDDNTPAYDEDQWKTLLIRNDRLQTPAVVVKCIFKCVRCLSLNVDFETGGVVTTKRQIYGLLARDRRVNEQFPRKNLT